MFTTIHAMLYKKIGVANAVQLMYHTLVASTLANCRVSVGQRPEMFALPIVHQLTICQQWPSVEPHRIYC